MNSCFHVTSDMYKRIFLASEINCSKQFMKELSYSDCTCTISFFVNILSSKLPGFLSTFSFKQEMKIVDNLK